MNYIYKYIDIKLFIVNYIKKKGLQLDNSVITIEYYTIFQEMKNTICRYYQIIGTKINESKGGLSSPAFPSPAYSDLQHGQALILFFQWQA